MSKRRHIARAGRPETSLCGRGMPGTAHKRLCGTCARLSAEPVLLPMDDVERAEDRWGANSGRTPFARERVWTPERVAAALKAYVRRTTGQLPSGSDQYWRMKSGDPSLPVANMVIEQYGAISRAWLAVGAPKSRVALLGCAWTDEEEAFLLERAGNMTLRDIAKRLHRSWPACKRKLYDLGTRARDAQGYMSGMQVAEEYGCSIHRVYDLIRSGALPAHHPAGKVNIWAIDPADAMAIKDQLREPNRTHKAENGYRVASVEHRRYYGIRRTVLLTDDEFEAVAS